MIRQLFQLGRTSPTDNKDPRRPPGGFIILNTFLVIKMIIYKSIQTTHSRKIILFLNKTICGRLIK